ncbi:MAG: nickel-dependent hydrogenase large subunit, partial [Deltaproteobacteria bacterium]|nr:nickel-dependent hydrogenase large subunit [Deltaproteobacteria bacterium]
LGIEPVCHNPYQCNTAQLVECVHVVHEALRLIEELRAAKLTSSDLMVEVSPRAGVGASAVEVPRGILYHEYEYGDDGRVVKANCVIPTTQNNANIQHDIEALAAEFAAKGTSDAELTKLCSMLVRAYDPCISCSVH